MSGLGFHVLLVVMAKIVVFVPGICFAADIPNSGQ